MPRIQSSTGRYSRFSSQVAHAARFAVEAFEPRLLLAAVAWDGGGDGVNWTDPLNWSTNALPTDADDVTINVLGTPSINLNAPAKVRSLANAETLIVDAAFGQTNLEVVTTISNSGVITLTSSTGFGALLGGTGAATTNNAGGTIRLAGVGFRQLAGSFINNGLMEWQTGISGQGNTPSFTNNGVITAAAGVDFSLDMSTGQFTQAGTVTGTGNPRLVVANSAFRQTGGTITGNGLRVQNSTIEITGGGAGSVVLAEGSNSLVAHTAANATVRVLSSNFISGSILTVASTQTTTGIIELSSENSGFGTRLRVGNGVTFTSAGALRFSSGASGTRGIDLGDSGAAATFVNSGTIHVENGVDAEIVGNTSPGPLDTFRQNGVITHDGNGRLVANSVRLHYVSGQHSSALRVFSSELDLEGSSSAVRLDALGLNTLIGHDAPNITLVVLGSNQAGSARLDVKSSMTTTGPIELTTIDSSWASQLNIFDGVTLTNNGSILATLGAGGSRTVNIGNSGGADATLINGGTIAVDGDNLTLDVVGRSNNNDIFRQQGQVLISGVNASIVAQTVLLHYVSGSNQTGLFLINNSRLDLDGATSASTLFAPTVNTLLGHDAANLTLVVRGENRFGSAQLSINSSITTTGPIVLTTADSTWTARIQIANGATWTNAGTVTSLTGSGGQRTIGMGLGQATVAGFTNNGTISAEGATELEIVGQSLVVDTFTQNGSILTPNNGRVRMESGRLQYIGGSSQSGFYVTGQTEIDLEVASSPTTLKAMGVNTLLDHDAANITLVVEGNNQRGSATLQVPASTTTTGTIILTTADSTWSSVLALTTGTTLTNQGIIRATPGSAGARNIQLGNSTAQPTVLINEGTIDAAGAVNLEILGATNFSSTFRQNGSITASGGGVVMTQSLRLHYVGGSNQPGFEARGDTRIDLENASSTSTVVAAGNNQFIGNDSTNLTLVVRGSNQNGSGTINVLANATNSGTISMQVFDSSWTTQIFVADGATFTNTAGGVVRVEANTVGGTATFAIDATVPANPGQFVNNGTVLLLGETDINGSGRFVNNGVVEKPDGGETYFSPSFNNGPTGLVDVLAGTLRLADGGNIDNPAGAFLSGGVYRVADAARLAFRASPFQSPTLNTADIEVTGTGFVEFDQIQINRGRIALIDGADIGISPNFGGGTFINEGIIDLSPTSLFVVNGDMGLGGASQPVVRSEIASAADFGKLTVTGNLNLDSPISTSRFDPDLVGLYDPPLGTQFNVITAAAIVNAFDSFQGGLTPSGNVLSAVRPSSSILAVRIVPGPLPPPPQVIGQSFEFETRLAVNFTFDQDVSAFLSRKDFTIQNTTTGQTLASNIGFVTYNQPSNLATLTLPHTIANGDYVLTIDASDIANSAGVPASGSPITFPFWYLAGDANRSRGVTLDDFTVLAANFGQTGRTFSQGDFNYDNGVSLDDFTILAANFGRSLPPLADLPARRIAPDSYPSAFASDRLIEDVFNNA